MRFFVGCAVLLASFISVVAGQTHSRVDRVVVYKHERKLVLLSQGKELKSYKVALGGEPIGPKTRQGDHRTPEGVCVLDSRNAHSKYYKAFHISYPNVADKAAAGKFGVDPGGAIMLHGLPKQYAWVVKSHTLHDWTDGCIAVTNEEMDELWQSIRVGTPIEIRP